MVDNDAGQFKQWQENMIESQAKTVRLLAAVCALCFGAFGNALAAEQQFAGDNCAITIPDTWLAMTNVSPQPGMLAAFSDADGNRRVALQIIDKKPAAPLNDRFIAEFEKGFQETSGATISSGKYIEVDGIKSYEILGTMDLRGNHISTIARLVPGEDRYYNLLAMRFDGDANGDPELRQVIGSFRFLHHFVPSYPSSSPDTISYRIGQLTGGLIAVIAVVAVVIYSSRSKRTPRPPSLPPNNG